MTRRPAAERLFTPAFIALGVAELCYFTAFGVAIFALPLYVTGPIGGDEAAAGLAFGAFALSALVLRPIRRATGRRPRPPPAPPRRSPARRHEPRAARARRELRRDRRAPPPRRRRGGRLLRRRFRRPRRPRAARAPRRGALVQLAGALPRHRTRAAARRDPRAHVRIRARLGRRRGTGRRWPRA